MRSTRARPARPRRLRRAAANRARPMTATATSAWGSAGPISFAIGASKLSTCPIASASCPTSPATANTQSIGSARPKSASGRSSRSSVVLNSAVDPRGANASPVQRGEHERRGRPEDHERQPAGKQRRGEVDEHDARRRRDQPQLARDPRHPQERQMRNGEHDQRRPRIEEQHTRLGEDQRVEREHHAGGRGSASGGAFRGRAPAPPSTHRTRRAQRASPRRRAARRRATTATARSPA